MKSKTIFIIAFLAIFCANSLSAQDFAFPDFKAYPPFREMKCGLWINAVGDIAYKTFGCGGVSNESESVITDSLSAFMPEYEIIDYYLTWCYYVSDTTTDYANENDYMSELKNVVDTASFKILSPYYFMDKNYVYNYLPMYCGGHFVVSREIDRKTFKVFKSNSAFACDKNECFVIGRSIEGADPKTFQPIQCGEQLYSRDKNHVYNTDQPMTEAEIVKAEKEFGIQLKSNYSMKELQAANKKLVDSLKYIQEMPYIHSCNDSISWKIVGKGKEMIP